MINNIKKLLEDYDFEKIVFSKDLSKLGDSLANFIYSLALSSVYNNFEGAKVSNVILANAIKQSKFHYLLKNRLTRHEKGNLVEAILVYSWLKNKITVEESVTILSNNLKYTVDRKEKIESSTTAFIALLDYIYQKMIT